MKFLLGFCAYAALSLAAPTSVFAQQSKPLSPEQKARIENQFRTRVQNAIFGACNATAKVNNARERSKRCQCYAKAYVDKYSLGTLVAINKCSAKNKGNASIIPIMMEPQRKACRLP